MCSDVKMAHCIQEDRNFDGMPQYWRWLEYANYEGLDRVREVDYDLWAVNVSGWYNILLSNIYIYIYLVACSFDHTRIIFVQLWIKNCDPVVVFFYFTT